MSISSISKLSVLAALFLPLVMAAVNVDKLRLCCGFCKSNNLDSRSCKIFTENEKAECETEQRSQSSKLLRRIRVVETNEENVLLLTWLIPHGADEGGIAKSRFIEFYGCKKVGDVMSMNYMYEDEVVGFLEEQDTKEFGVILNDYDCNNELCEITIAKRVC